MNGIGGPGTQKGDLKAVTIIQDLRDAFLKLEPEVEPEVAEAPEVAEDPMDALDDVVIPTQPGKEMKPKEHRFHRMRSLQMPTRPLYACASEGTTSVITYGRKGNHNTNLFTLFLRVDCVDWLLSYGADQLHFQGVDNLVGNMDDVLDANYAAVAGLHVE